jgi:hypothetical protein
MSSKLIEIVDIDAGDTVETYQPRAAGVLLYLPSHPTRNFHRDFLHDHVNLKDEMQKEKRHGKRIQR